MARSINQIYSEIITERNKRLELSEFNSDSKMSIMNGIAWCIAAAIYSFESLMDVFMVDIAKVVENRVNGTPIYYINAIKRYQKGDELLVREDGLAFGYAETDESKQIVTQASYIESSSDVNVDNKLILKVATGESGKLEAIESEELVLIQSYINKIKFAGTRIEVISRKGDVLIPRLSVYYDGAALESDVYSYIEEQLNLYMQNISFDSAIYVSDIIAAIRKAQHVKDVYIDTDATPEQGVFVAHYDTDGALVPAQNIGRMTHTESGYLKESSKAGSEADIPNFREAIKLIIDNEI